jgi:hypothetical protein
VYHANQDTQSTDELYIVSILGGQSYKLNSPLVANGNVDYAGFKIAPNSQAVIYRADQEIDDKFELYLTIEGQAIFLPLAENQ